MFIVIILFICTVLSFIWLLIEQTNTPMISTIICSVCLLIASVSYSNTDHQKPNNPGYQLYLYDDSIVVKDDDRVVGKLGYDTELGRMVEKDNE